MDTWVNVMPMQINTNVAAINANRNLNASQGQLALSLQRLSSGLRINSAKDDAAGLAISDRMSTQIRGLNQASRNASDAISLLQTAEGAMGTVTANLQRIRELSVQAANSTNSQSDREALQKEVAQLVAEVNRVGSTSEFNGLKLFAQGNASVVGDADQLAVLDGLKLGWLEQSERLIADLYGISADGATMSIELTTFSDGAGGVAARVGSVVPVSGKGTNITMQIDMADFTPPNLPNGGSAPFYNDRIIAHEMVHAVMNRAMNFGDLSNNHQWFVEGTAEFIHGADERVASDINNYRTVTSPGATLAQAANFLVSEFGNGFSGSSADYSAGYVAVRYLHDRIKAAGGTGIKDVMTYMNTNQNATLDQAISAASSGAFSDYAAFAASFASNGSAFIQSMDLSNADTGAIGGLDADGGAIKTAESVILDTATRGTDDVLSGFTESFESIAVASSVTTERTFQVGANVGQTVDSRIGALSSVALGIADVDVVTHAQRAIGQIDRALDYLNTQRAELGAQMGRFETVIANLQTSAENLTASRSRVVDADYAAETAGLTRAQILQQAGTAMLAQANALPQVVLQLLG